MGFIIGGVLVILGIMGIKYGIEAILLGLTFLAVAFGIKKD